MFGSNPELDSILDLGVLGVVFGLIKSGFWYVGCLVVVVWVVVIVAMGDDG